MSPESCAAEAARAVDAAVPPDAADEYHVTGARSTRSSSPLVGRGEVVAERLLAKPAPVRAV